MKKKYLLVIFMSLILLFTTSCSNKNDNEDAIKFKEEYESLNDTKNANDMLHRTVNIDENNPFVYATGQEIVEKIENKETFYVYFGSAYCPWCRSVMEKLIEVAHDKNITTIYYVDIWEGDHKEILRDTYELVDGKPVKTQDGGPFYAEILKYFDSVLADYTLTDEDGKKISVGEKRIFAPNFISVVDGKPTRLVEGVSSKQKGSLDELTDEILEEEKQIFEDFFSHS